MIYQVNCELDFQNHKKKKKKKKITTTSTNQTTPKYHQSTLLDTLMQKLYDMLGQL